MKKLSVLMGVLCLMVASLIPAWADGGRWEKGCEDTQKIHAMALWVDATIIDDAQSGVYAYAKLIDCSPNSYQERERPVLEDPQVAIFRGPDLFFVRTNSNPECCPSPGDPGLIVQVKAEVNGVMENLEEYIPFSELCTPFRLGCLQEVTMDQLP